MNPAPRLHVALIGHQFMGKAHSHALHDLPFFFDLPVQPVRKVLCGIGPGVEEAAKRYGWESSTSDWESVVSDPEIDAVGIATPGNLHCEMAVAAACNGKHVLCEKPLANSLEEARRMLAAVVESGVKNVVNFNYRRLPAVQLARQLITEGRLGTIYHFTGIYQQDWPLSPDFPHIWRFDKSIAGAGSMADKGSHIIDLARFLVGEVTEVSAATTIFVRERPLAGGRARVTTDDAALVIARFENEAVGVFETSRMSAGRKNSLRFEVNGSEGSLIFDLERLNELKVYFASEAAETQGFRTIMVTQPSHPYMNRWWPPGHIIGWEHGFIHQYYEFLKAIVENQPTSPNFHDGAKAQAVIEAIDRAADSRQWTPVEPC